MYTRKKPYSEADRQAEYDAVIEPDPLLAEVGEDNERVTAPGQAKRVILSRPCVEEAAEAEDDSPGV